jgi:glucosamine 6-phosphate synthetase-like amidotransferase/phosphosugar isomerase protein
MCGLAGFAGDLSLILKTDFERLLHVTQLRGFHSTGVAGINRLGDIKVCKDVGSLMDLKNLKNYDETVSVMSSLWLGHARHATEGAINKQNAHPFNFNGTVGVHNGTLRDKTYLEGKEYPVDSAQLIYTLSKKDPEDVFANITGAWACIWWQDNELFFIRNDERPLYIGTTKDKKVMFWASELEDIVWMISKSKTLKIDEVDIFQPKVNTLYVYELPSKDFKTFSEPEVVEIKPKAEVKHSQRFFQGHYTPRVIGTNNTANGPQQDQKTTTEQNTKNGKKTTPVIATLDGDKQPSAKNNLAIECFSKASFALRHKPKVTRIGTCFCGKKQDNFLQGSNLCKWCYLDKGNIPEDYAAYQDYMVKF